MLWILVIFMIFLFKIEKHVRQLRGFKLMKVYTTSHTIPSFYHTLSVLRITCLFFTYRGFWCRQDREGHRVLYRIRR